MKFSTLALISLLTVTAPWAMADEQADVAAIKALLQQYRATQDAGDLAGQAKLMTPDRVWINQAGTRRTDNVENMKLQQLAAEYQKKRAPGLRNVTMDRDLLIKFYGGGQVAIASFYRTAARFYSPDTPKEIMEEYGHGGYETGTLVLEKQQGQWKIVHTHWSGPTS